jgi:hypothetical protein
MTISAMATHEEIEEDYNKFICEGLYCHEKATEQLDLPFGEYGSTLFFLCENCAEKIR